MSATLARIPEVELTRVQGRVNRLWRPAEGAAHHLILGTNGAGKTRLITDALLPLAAMDRVLIIDVKGDDPSWDVVDAAVIDRVAPQFGAERDGGGPFGLWYRLVVDPLDRATARRAVGAALDVCTDEGHVVLVCDEIRALTDHGQLGLADALEALMMQGRSRNVSAIVAGQATQWITGAARSQWAFAWLGQLTDDRVRREALQIIGLSAAEGLPTLRTIGRRRWLYSDRAEGADIRALTQT